MKKFNTHKCNKLVCHWYYTGAVHRPKGSQMLRFVLILGRRVHGTGWARPSSAENPV